MAYSAGAVVAAAAAEKRRQMLLAEEEDMTEYTQDDLKSDWEFKIVRSDTAAFRKPEVLNELLEQEAQAIPPNPHRSNLARTVVGLAV